jgi:Vault protein inter-alpha-trypsin domain
MRSYLYICILLLAVCRPLFCQESLNVADPRQWGSPQQGTIEEAILTAEPQGAFMACSMELVFSARGTRWEGRNDSLEIDLKFTLPAQAVVHDSWLWIGDDIIKGQMLDRQLARTIYENYVRRRTDPSILFKNSDTQYEFRVFPMAGNQTRRVRIAYLVPMEIRRNSVQAMLPMQLLKSSRFAPKTTILAKANVYGREPILSGSVAILKVDQPAGWYKANLSVVPESMRLSFVRPNPAAAVVSTLKSGPDEGFYECVYFPDIPTSTTRTIKKIAFVVDYVEKNPRVYSRNTVIEQLRETIRRHLVPGDSFNIFINHVPLYEFGTWIKYQEDKLDDIFRRFYGDQVIRIYDLPTLLTTALQFVQRSPKNGTIVVVSNANDIHTSNTDTYINDIVRQMGSSTIPIHVADYNTTLSSYYLNNQWQQGDSYFLTQLASRTNGNYNNIRNWESVERLLSETMVQPGTILENFDLHTGLANGFCYGRYFPINGGESVRLGQPIVQIGRWKGSMPFNIKLGGVYDGKLFQQNIQLDANQIVAADTLLREWWFGAYLRPQEKDNRPNIAQQTIKTSIEERVLTRQTALFCPEDKNLICKTCGDVRTYIVSAKEDEEDAPVWQASPNPFTDVVRFQLKHEKLAGKPVRIDIFSITGALVKVLEANADSNGEVLIQWDDAQQNVPAGMYIALLRVEGGRQHAIKLVKQ